MDAFPPDVESSNPRQEVMRPWSKACIVDVVVDDVLFRTAAASADDEEDDDRLLIP